MKLIIDIDEDRYEDTKRIASVQMNYRAPTIEQIVANGTPLEQEPSGDLISRQAVNEIINDIRDCISVEGYWAILERIKKLPSVYPQEPTDKSNLEKICEELAAENDDLRDQLAMRDRFKQEPKAESEG